MDIICIRIVGPMPEFGEYLKSVIVPHLFPRSGVWMFTHNVKMVTQLCQVSLIQF